jgi:hypothetical protein
MIKSVSCRKESEMPSGVRARGAKEFRENKFL